MTTIGEPTTLCQQWRALGWREKLTLAILAPLVLVGLFGGALLSCLIVVLTTWARPPATDEA
jgi:hypothetical protein